MAATLDPATQAGIGAFAGLVEVSINQVRPVLTRIVSIPRHWAPAPIRPKTTIGTDAPTELTPQLHLPQPLHTLKNFTQDGRMLPMNPAVWYRGWTAGVLIGVPMKVVQFGGSRQLERAIGGSASDVDVLTNPSWSTRVASALLAGAVSGAVINPLDVCMTQQQKFGGSLGGVVSGLARTHGPKVAFRGVRATMAREGLYACGYLCGAPWLRERAGSWVPEGAKRRGLDAFVAAAAAGGTAGVLTQPIDTVKTLMQSNLGDGGTRRGKGYVATARDLVRHDGVRALWRGTVPRAARIASATVVLAAVNEMVGERVSAARAREGTGADPVQ